ncbi:hypothetical protein GGF32_002696 [Allomyces javanicus]|nr:hypothetical protein GGF32_002696 [Allomyces javanicus]
MLSPRRADAPSAAASSFKLSNKVLKDQPRVRKDEPAVVWVDPGRIDIDLYHEKKMQYFADLRNVTLPRAKKALAKCRTHAERHRLTAEIEAIESGREESEYLSHCLPIVQEYLALKQNASHDTVGIDRPVDVIVQKSNTSQQQELFNRYYTYVDPTKVNLKHLFYEYLTCEDCGANMYLASGSFSCSECGLVSKKVSGDFQWSYKDIQDVQYKSSFSYKRVNRFKEILCTMQAKENTDIPPQVIDTILAEMEKESVQDIETLDIKKIRYYLKKTGNNRYYEHAPSIINKVTGCPPIRIDQQTEETLVAMFSQIQQPFEEVRQALYPARSSFLSYMYVFHKFFELLGRHDCLALFPLLKSSEKLKVQDRIWQGMCEILGWRYIPSI